MAPNQPFVASALVLFSIIAAAADPAPIPYTLPSVYGGSVSEIPPSFSVVALPDAPNVKRASASAEPSEYTVDVTKTTTITPTIYKTLSPVVTTHHTTKTKTQLVTSTCTMMSASPPAMSASAPSSVHAGAYEAAAPVHDQAKHDKERAKAHEHSAKKKHKVGKANKKNHHKHKHHGKGKHPHDGEYAKKDHKKHDGKKDKGHKHKHAHDHDGKKKHKSGKHDAEIPKPTPSESAAPAAYAPAEPSGHEGKGKGDKHEPKPSAHASASPVASALPVAYEAAVKSPVVTPYFYPTDVPNLRRREEADADEPDLEAQSEVKEDDESMEDGAEYELQVEGFDSDAEGSLERRGEDDDSEEPELSEDEDSGSDADAGADEEEAQDLSERSDEAEDADTSSDDLDEPELDESDLATRDTETDAPSASDFDSFEAPDDAAFDDEEIAEADPDAKTSDHQGLRARSEPDHTEMLKILMQFEPEVLAELRKGQKHKPYAPLPVYQGKQKPGVQHRRDVDEDNDLKTTDENENMDQEDLEARSDADVDAAMDEDDDDESLEKRDKMDFGKWLKWDLHHHRKHDYKRPWGFKGSKKHPKHHKRAESDDIEGEEADDADLEARSEADDDTVMDEAEDEEPMEKRGAVKFGKWIDWDLHHRPKHGHKRPWGFKDLKHGPHHHKRAELDGSELEEADEGVLEKRSNKDLAGIAGGVAGHPPPRKTVYETVTVQPGAHPSAAPKSKGPSPAKGKGHGLPKNWMKPIKAEIMSLYKKVKAMRQKHQKREAGAEVAETEGAGAEADKYDAAFEDLFDMDTEGDSLIQARDVEEGDTDGDGDNDTSTDGHEMDEEEINQDAANYDSSRSARDWEEYQKDMMARVEAAKAADASRSKIAQEAGYAPPSKRRTGLLRRWMYSFFE